MNILVCGASGFVGSSIVNALEKAGHHCVHGVRKPEASNEEVINYLRGTEPEYWKVKLKGIDAVVNAVGVLRDTSGKPMERIHHQAPSALFTACAESDVRYIVNMSALGVDSGLETSYFRTKKGAEKTLFNLPENVKWLNLRPSVIYGEQCASAKMFRFLASMPVHCLPKGGPQMMQPVHIDDLVQAIMNWLSLDAPDSLNLEVAGSEAITFRQMLDSYRAQMNKKPALHIPVPGILVDAGALAGDFLPFSPLCRDTQKMLDQGSTCDTTAFEKLLGHQPRGVSSFLIRDQ